MVACVFPCAPPFGRSSNVETYLECKRPTPSAVTLTPLFPAPRGGIAYALRPQGFWPAPLGRDLSMAPCGAAEKAFRIKNAPPGGGAAVHPGLVSYARSGEYLMPSPQGYEFLSGIDQTCQPPTKRPYAQSPRPPPQAGGGGPSCLPGIGAGIEPASQGRTPETPASLFPRLCPPKRRSNLMNAAGCAGFGHWALPPI